MNADALSQALAAEVSTGFVHVDDGKFAVTMHQDIGPILDANIEAQNTSDGYSPSRELRHVARIPLVVYEEWRTKHGVDMLNRDHRDGVRRLLNSREYYWLRTSLGRI